MNPHVVDSINRGHTHIAEPGLAQAVQEAVAQGYLQAGSHPVSAEVFLIAVPTPLTADHQPDVSFVEAAVLSLAPVLKPGIW